MFVPGTAFEASPPNTHMDLQYWLPDEVGGGDQDPEDEEDGGGEGVVQLTHGRVYVGLTLERQ